MTNENTVSREIRNRIRLSIAAYAFHIENHHIMADREFNELERSIDSDMPTGSETLDDFFKSKFKCNGGAWIRRHPHVTGLLRHCYEKYHNGSPPLTYDQRRNRDLFGPILTKPEPVKEPCRRCGNSILKPPNHGGCYC